MQGDDPNAIRHFELDIRPAARDAAWRAALREVGMAPAQVMEFDSPLELVRYLARLTYPQRGPSGLR